jgi:hypothetical protein
VKAQVDERVYQAEVGLTELALEDPDQIVTAVREVRSGQASPGRAG